MLREILCVKRHLPKLSSAWRSAPLLYGKEKPQVPKGRKVDSKKKSLSSSVISTSRERKKTTRRVRVGKKDGVREAEAEEVRIDVDEEESHR